VFQLFNISLTIGIGNHFSNINVNNFREQYLYSFNLTNNRFILGKGLIFDSSCEISSNESNDKINLIFASIVNCVKQGNYEEYENNFSMLYDILKAYSYKKVILVFFNLVQELLQLSAELSLDLDIPQDEEDLYATLNSFQDYTELSIWFEKLFKIISSSISSIKNRKTQNFIENTLQYLNKSYMDSNISAGLIAEKLGITPQYFSKIFKKYTGMSFPDYINNLRLEKAKELLSADSFLSICEICEKTGYNSQSYFTTAFTKKFGIPPAKYVLLKNMNCSL
jgi:two-component system, response regulator YesN